MSLDPLRSPRRANRTNAGRVVFRVYIQITTRRCPWHSREGEASVFTSGRQPPTRPPPHRLQIQMHRNTPRRRSLQCRLPIARPPQAVRGGRMIGRMLNGHGHKAIVLVHCDPLSRSGKGLVDRTKGLPLHYFKGIRLQHVQHEHGYSSSAPNRSACSGSISQRRGAMSNGKMATMALTFL